jgi:hypothetical protein
MPVNGCSWGCQRVLAPVIGPGPPQAAESATARVPRGWSWRRRDPGRHVLIVGPCRVVLTGRWIPIGLTGLWVTGLAVALGLPDGIWGTAIFFTRLGAVAVVALASTAAAAFIQTLGPARPR